MKKLTYVTQFFAALLLLMQFSSCDDLPAPEPVSEDNARPADVVNYGSPVMKDGVYINKPASSSNFRYAAAVIANADGSMDMWLSAPGAGYGEAEKWDTLNTAASQSAMGPLTAKTGDGAIKATMEEDFFSWGAHCPNWSSQTFTSFAFSLYEWNTDYATTLKGEPIATHDFIGYGDGVWLDLTTRNSGYFEKTGNIKFPAGTYLLYMKSIEGTAGWWGIGAKKGVTYWMNGTEQTDKGQRNRVQYSAPSDFSYTDQISWRTAGVTDIHATWSVDSLDLAPAEFGNDRTCAKEPSVVKIGEYYYMAYTGSYNQEDMTKDNSVFAARTKTLGDKSWEKWNGTGWGGETPEGRSRRQGRDARSRGRRYGQYERCEREVHRRTEPLPCRAGCQPGPEQQLHRRLGIRGRSDRLDADRHALRQRSSLRGLSPLCERRSGTRNRRHEPPARVQLRLEAQYGQTLDLRLRIR